VTVRVKICGVTRRGDALEAAALGADALGFNFWPGSKRHLSMSAARVIIEALPPFVTPVGVFVNPPLDEVLRALDRTGIQMVQLHGNESPRLCARIPVPVIKALPVSSRASLRALSRYRVAAYLLDTATPGYGGSGHTFDWGVLSSLPRAAPVVLAGGLTPQNVAEAIRRVQPYAVDVASGVESSPGVKDSRKMARFIRAAKDVA
jgi:phosphoribosylanthranilate isomerase